MRLRPKEEGYKIYDQTTTNAWTSGVCSVELWESIVISVFNRGGSPCNYRIHVSPDITEANPDWVEVKSSTQLGANDDDFETLAKTWDAVKVSFASGAVNARAYVRGSCKQ